MNPKGVFMIAMELIWNREIRYNLLVVRASTVNKLKVNTLVIYTASAYAYVARVAVMTPPCQSTHWLSTASAGSAFVSPVPSPKRPCRAGKCSPVLRPRPRPSVAFPSAPSWPSRLRSRSHRRSVPYLRQAVSRPHRVLFQQIRSGN